MHPRVLLETHDVRTEDVESHAYEMRRRLSVLHPSCTRAPSLALSLSHRPQLRQPADDGNPNWIIHAASNPARTSSGAPHRRPLRGTSTQASQASLIDLQHARGRPRDH